MILAIPFPVIDPILIEIGPLAIRWYALAYVAGILGCWYVVKRLASTWPGAPDARADKSHNDPPYEVPQRTARSAPRCVNGVNRQPVVPPRFLQC